MPATSISRADIRQRHASSAWGATEKFRVCLERSGYRGVLTTAAVQTYSPHTDRRKADVPAEEARQLPMRECKRPGRFAVTRDNARVVGGGWLQWFRGGQPAWWPGPAAGEGSADARARGPVRADV